MQVCFLRVAHKYFPKILTRWGGWPLFYSFRVGTPNRKLFLFIKKNDERTNQEQTITPEPCYESATRIVTKFSTIPAYDLIEELLRIVKGIGIKWRMKGHENYNH